MYIHASARIVSTESARLGSRVSRGLEPVCNKINRGGGAREDTRQRRVGRRGRRESLCGGGFPGAGAVRVVWRMKGQRREDKTTPPATPTLWMRRRTAMECLLLFLLLLLFSPPLPTGYSTPRVPETPGLFAPRNGRCCHRSRGGQAANIHPDRTRVSWVFYFR